MTRNPVPCLLALASFTLTAGCSTGPPATLQECLAPANPGGGWDLTCRSFSRAVAEVAPGASGLRVTNLPGAGGGIGFAHVVSRRKGDAGLLVAASPATTLRLAQGQFGDFTENDVRWVAAIAADFGVIAVKADAPWEDLPSLIGAWKEHPESIVSAGGSAVGGQDHMKILLLGRTAGMDIRRVRYVPFDGGGEALSSLLGGFVHVVPADASEVLGHVRAGTLRVLAVLARERLPAPLEDVPTAEESGFPVEWPIWRGFYAPLDITNDAYDAWLDLADRVAHSESWSRIRRQLGLSPFFLKGAEFESFIEAQVATFRALTRDLGLTE